MRFPILASGYAALALLGCGDVEPQHPVAGAGVVGGPVAATTDSTRVKGNEPAQTSSSALRGTWGVVSAECEGEPLVLPRASLRQTYEGNRARFGSPQRTSESEFAIDETADPPHYDVGSGNRVEQGIYRLDGDVLTICSAESSHSRPADFITRPGDGRTLMVFRRMHLDKLDQPITQDEADAFARQVEHAAKDGNAESLNAVIDFEGILDRITQGLGIPENKRLSFLHGLQSKSQALSGGPTSLGAKIVAIVGDGGYFRVRRVTFDEAGWRVLCRVVTAQGGLNYQEFTLGRDVFGNAVATDVFLFATGDRLSAIQLRALLPSLSQLSPSVAQQLPARDRVYIQNADQLREYVVRLQSGEFEAAEKLYQRLPQSVRSEKWLLLGRLSTANKQDRSRILQECLELHPEEPAFEIFAMEDAIGQADKEKALELIDRLGRRVGDDPYLNVLRAKACQNSGDVDGSRRFLEEAQTAEPELRRIAQRAAHPM